MDEPTASLGAGEVERLFEVVGGLRDQGISIVFISHRLDEVMRIADRITVLRDGTTVGTVDATATSHDDIDRNDGRSPSWKDDQEDIPRHRPCPR